MAVTPNSIITPQGVNQAGQSFVNGDGTTVKTLLTAGANGSIVRGISAVTTDTSANDVNIFINDGSTNWLIGTPRVPIGAGTGSSVAAKDLLNATDLPFLKIDAAGNPILVLKAGFVLKAAVVVAVTAAKTLTLFTYGEDL